MQASSKGRLRSATRAGSNRTQLLFGADGLHSGVRSKVIDDEALCSGYTAYRGAVPIETVDRRVAFDDVVVWVGAGPALRAVPRAWR